MSHKPADEQKEDEGGSELHERAAEGRPDHSGRGHRHGRPVGQGGTAQADQDRVASFIGGIEQALDDPCVFEADQAGPQSLRYGAVGDEAPLGGRKERLRVAVERAGVRDSGKPQAVMICRSRTLDTIVVRKCFIGCPAESTLRPSPTKVAPGLRRLITRPETDHPCSRTRSTGDVG